MASGRQIWNVTVEPNSNYANVSWRHNFPAGSSEFVLEFTLDSKKPDWAQMYWTESSEKGLILEVYPGWMVGADKESRQNSYKYKYVNGNIEIQTSG